MLFIVCAQIHHLYAKNNSKNICTELSTFRRATKKYAKNWPLRPLENNKKFPFYIIKACYCIN